MPSYLLITLLLPLLLLNLPLTTPTTDPSDAAAMRDLSLSLSAALPLNWDPTSDPCSWPHLTCSDGKITAIQIGNKTLSGFLPPSISNLTSLTSLELQLNRISGPLPSLKGLSQLQKLLLHDNNFTSMPPDFFAGLSSLQSVSIDNNPFEPWEIPASLADAAALVNFSANAVNLTGGVPDIFSSDKFASLNLLALANNLLEGSLPEWLAGSPVSVLWLNQKGNGGGLSGGIDVIQNMTNLSQLWLHSNNFTGALPDFSGLKNLEDLQLRDNKFSGPVPDSLFLLESLKTVTLTNNLLQGPVPVFPSGVKVDLDPDTESFCLLKPGKCDPRVMLLISIVGSFGYPRKFADNWEGNDPCGNWLGISCDRDGNITVLNFINMGLIGVISPAFSLFPSLQRLLLSQNNISGTIPGSLIHLVNLKQLDLSNNSLHGELPKFGKDVVVKINGNPGLLNSAIGPPSPGSVVADAHNKTRESSDVSTGIIVGCVFGVVILLFTGCLAFHLCKRNNKPSSKIQSPHSLVIDSQHSRSARSKFKTEVTGSSGEISSPGSSGPNDVHMIDSGNMVIPIHVLRHVTNNFSDDNILGQGGFGTVYKGELHDGTKIAVKRMESGVIGSKGLKEFQAEITVLSKVRHRHLVSLLGYCLDANERLLVYEYMTQGTLSQHLFNWEEEGLKSLDWKKRLSIAVDVARGVEYLHTLAHQSFIHRDLKPSNILLGDDLKAKVSDFGLVRLAPDGKCSVETRLAGTFGYLAPEYAVTGRVTTKADVFSFGVILMELITGRKALDNNRPEESIHLVSWFKRMQYNKDLFHKIIDPTIDPDNETLTSINKVAELAGHCCTREPYQRPDMGHAVNVLSSLSNMWKPTDSDSLEDIFGIGLNLTLPEAVKKWQELELRSQSAASSSNLASQENTQSSIPTVMTDFADSFTSADGR